MMRIPLAALPFLCITGASAANLTLALPEGTPVQQLQATYTCPEGAALTVSYVTVGDSALAVVPVEGKPLIFANVMAASGVRYAAGAYVWWTKGQDAALYDVRKGENSAPIMTCQEKT